MTISYLTQLYANNAETTLVTTVSSTGTSLVVSSAVAFPTPATGQFFSITLDDGDNVEIVYVYGRSGNTFTSCARGQEGTTARAYAQGTLVECRLTAGAISEFARTSDALSKTPLLVDLQAPETLNDHSYVIEEGDDVSTPIIALASGTVWGLMNYPIVVTSQTVTTSTATSVHYTGSDISPSFSIRGLVIQFLSGANRGACRFVSAATSTTLFWATSLASAPAAGDQFRVYQSYTSKFATIIGVDTVTVSQMNSAISSGVSAHVAATDPHPQYQTSTEVSTAVTSAISAHVAASNPHPQYSTSADIASAISAHVAASNPHSQYQTASQVSTAVSAGVSAHVAASDPHNQYIQKSGGTFTGAVNVPAATSSANPVQLSQMQSSVSNAAMASFSPEAGTFEVSIQRAGGAPLLFKSGQVSVADDSVVTVTLSIPFPSGIITVFTSIVYDTAVTGAATMGSWAKPTNNSTFTVGYGGANGGANPATIRWLAVGY